MVHPLFSVYQLWAALNKTAQYLILVPRIIPKKYSRKPDQLTTLLINNQPYRTNVEEIMNF